jgi:hypothetical protein
MDIEGVAKIEELRKSKIRGGEGQLSFLTGSKAGRLGTGGQDVLKALNVRDQVSGRLGARILAVLMTSFAVI